MFIAATLQIETQNLKQGEIPSDKLNRFEFLEILVRLADAKFVQTKKIKSVSEATKVLIEDYIMKNFTPEPWQKFRDEQLWTIDVNDVLEANLENLKKIYQSYLTQVHKFMDLKDCIAVCAPLEMSEKDIALAFGMSKMMVIDEVRFYKKYQQLEFVEFLEFIGRAADVKYKGSGMASEPLASKIENVLDEIMLPFNLNRSEVEVQIEEFSESDDDY